MKTKNRLLSVVAVLIVTLMLTGCLGGGGKENLQDQTVPQFLEEVTDAFASLQATRIANLIDFPIIISGTGEPLAVLGSNNLGAMVNESAERIELKIERADFLEMTEGLLQIAKNGGTRLLVKITNPAEGKMNITVNGDIATVENGVLLIEGEVSVETAEALFRDFMTTVRDFMLEIFEEEMQDGLTDEGWNEMLDNMWDDFLAEQEWTEEFDLTQELPPFKLKKVNKKWKFNLDVDFDQIDPA